MNYICNVCETKYCSYKSLWNHNKKFHSDLKIRISDITKKGEHKCPHCEKKFTRKNNMVYHINNFCKINTIQNVKIDKNKINKFIKCCECKNSFKNSNEFDNHLKLFCKPLIKHNNIYDFDTSTFGKYKYPKDNGGDMYIIQTDFNLNGYYKIGVSINLQNRLHQYRCGSVLEPRIHCYFPIKNIRKADKTMKLKLLKYNVKREIYNCNNIEELTDILKSIQKEYNSEEINVIPKIKNCNEKFKSENLENNINYELDNLKNEIKTLKNSQLNKNFILDNSNEIFDKNIDSVDTFIKKINFNKNLPSNHSFCTTNLEGPYLSVYDSNQLKITKDRKKYFFEQLFTKAVKKMKELYGINKEHFNKNKQQQIEDTLQRLVELQNMDMNTKIYKEMIKN